MHMRFSCPASRWIDALPIGNGSLGAMVFGTVPDERIQINEHTVWEGRSTTRVNPTAVQMLPEIRKALFGREYGTAQQLVEKHMLAGNCTLKPYQPLCDLLVCPVGSWGETVYAFRELDLLAGVHRVQYSVWDRTLYRECFASLTHGVIVARFWADGGKGTSYRVRLDREQDVTAIHIHENAVVLKGQLGDDGVRFQAQAMVLPEGGTLRGRRNAIEVSDADAVTVILVGATSYVAADDLTADPAARCAASLARVQGMAYQQLRDAHVQAHAKRMNRVQLQIGGGEDQSARTTDQRLAAFSRNAQRRLSDESFQAIATGSADWNFYSTIFQACRYMLLASSQPGSMPSTLQGRWCGSMSPAWNSDYHPNINLQMNYWLANPTHLDECNKPLFDWLKEIVRHGRETARTLYGCDGWVLHHVSDIFANTGPMDGPCGVWPVGGAWMCQHLWEHFQFTQDKEFLKETALPIMLESARFMLDFLVEAPAGTPFAGRLVTAPSHSPENTFLTDTGEQVWFCVSATMDTQIIDQLFRNCLAGLVVLGESSPLKPLIADALKRLPPMQVSPTSGRLMEWIEDFAEAEPGHRHISHLFAVYPGDGIRLRQHPELAAAARKSIEHRLANDYHATGWSLPWLACIFARLGDGNKALEMLTHRIAHFTMPNGMFSNAHGQPQVGDACGFAAAIAEMLVQSHEGFINILPALPEKWPAGRVTGLKARGGFELDITWQDGRVSCLKIKSHSGNPCRLLLNGRMQDLAISAGSERQIGLDIP